MKHITYSVMGAFEFNKERLEQIEGIWHFESIEGSRCYWKRPSII